MCYVWIWFDVVVVWMVGLNILIVVGVGLDCLWVVIGVLDIVVECVIVVVLCVLLVGGVLCLCVDGGDEEWKSGGNESYCDGVWMN